MGMQSHRAFLPYAAPFTRFAGASPVGGRESRMVSGDFDGNGIDCKRQSSYPPYGHLPFLGKAFLFYVTHGVLESDGILTIDSPLHPLRGSVPRWGTLDHRAAFGRLARLPEEAWQQGQL